MPGYVRARRTKDGKLIKRKDGTRYWQARYWDPAGQRVEKMFRSKREAERWLTQQGADALNGTHIDPRKGERRFEKVAAEWRDTWTHLEPKTRAGYEAILDRWLMGEHDPLHPSKPARFRGVPVAAISPDLIQRFINELAAGRAPNTVRRIYSVLRHVLRLAVERRYIAVNPCDAVKLPSKKRVGVRRSFLYLEGSELRTLATAMDDHYRLAVYIAGSCGLRAGELWALRRRDVDLLHGELAVRYAMKEINSSAASLADDKGLIIGPPKSRASRRTLSIPGGVGSMLEALMSSPGVRAREGYAVARAVDEDRCDIEYTTDPSDPDRLLFVTTTGRPVRHNLFYKRVFRRTLAGLWPKGHRLHGLRWHDLRHTCAVLSLQTGAGLDVVKERLGHENISTTIDLYAKRAPSVDAALAEAVGESIFEREDNVVPLEPREEEPPEATAGVV